MRIAKSHAKEIKYLIQRAQRQGFTVRQTKSGHYQVKGPAGGLTHLPSTPSDRRAVNNSLAELKRMGYRHEG